MAITVPSNFDYSSRQGIRLQEAIVGDTSGNVRVLVNNSTWIYATVARRLIHSGGWDRSDPLTTANGSAGAFVDIYQVWLKLSADTTGLTWAAWQDDCNIEVQAYHDSTGADSLATASDGDPARDLDQQNVSTTGESAATDNLDLSGRAGDFVLVDIRMKSATATASDAKLYTFQLWEDALTAGELPT
jgi:hypothetical protein